MNPQTPIPQPFYGRKISQQGVNVTQATDKQLVLKEDYNEGTTIYYDDSGVANVLIGKRPLTGIRGFYVAIPGVDVTLAMDEELVFNSEQDIFKIVTSSTTQIPGFNLGNSQLRINSVVIPHGLDFIPILQAYALVTLAISLDGSTFTTVTAYVSLPYSPPASTFYPDATVTSYGITALVDATNIYFSYQYSTASTGGGFNFPVVPIRYYLLQETAN